VIALECGVRQHPALARIIALSTYVALAETFPPADPVAAPAILMMHGSMDPIVPLAVAEESQRLLLELGYPLEWHVLRMAHGVCGEEIVLIRRWLGQRLGYA